MVLFRAWKKLARPQAIEKRKKYRYALPPLISGHLEIKLPKDETLMLRVMNLNDEAIAGEYDAEFDVPILEMAGLPAALTLDDFQLSLEVDLLRYSRGFMVFRYVDLDGEDVLKLRNFFLVILGKSLEERDVDQKTCDWIHGMNYTDIFIQREEAQAARILSLTYVSEDIYFYWNREGGRKTGSVKREIYSEGLGFAKRKQNPVILDTQPDPQKIEHLSQIIENSSLSPTLNDEVVSILRTV